VVRYDAACSDFGLVRRPEAFVDCWRDSGQPYVWAGAVPMLMRAARSSVGAGLFAVHVYDVGSGRPRAVCGAEYPFRKVIGVEFSNALHDDAVAN